MTFCSSKAPSTRAIFMWQFLYNNFYLPRWQTKLTNFCTTIIDICWKKWSFSRHVANKNCHTQKIVRVDETTHQIAIYFDVIRRFQSSIFCCHKNCSYRFQSSVDYTSIVRIESSHPSIPVFNLLLSQKLSNKNCLLKIVRVDRRGLTVKINQPLRKPQTQTLNLCKNVGAEVNRQINLLSGAFVKFGAKER